MYPAHNQVPLIEADGAEAEKLTADVLLPFLPKMMILIEIQKDLAGRLYGQH
jgi:hypothetical protein